MVNPDYENPNAKAAGVPTYTYRDPELRRKQLNIAIQHGRRRGPGFHNKNLTGDATTTFNHYTVVRRKDGSGRYEDKWDFPIDIGK